MSTLVMLVIYSLMHWKAVSDDHTTHLQTKLQSTIKHYIGYNVNKLTCDFILTACSCESIHI